MFDYITLHNRHTTRSTLRLIWRCSLYLLSSYMNKLKQVPESRLFWLWNHHRGAKLQATGFRFLLLSPYEILENSPKVFHAVVPIQTEFLPKSRNAEICNKAIVMNWPFILLTKASI